MNNWKSIRELEEIRTHLKRKKGQRDNLFLKAFYKYSSTKSNEDKIKLSIETKKKKELDDQLNEVEDEIERLKRIEWEKALNNINNI